VSLKNYVRFTNEIGFHVSNISTSDEPHSQQKSCYTWNIDIKYKVARQQMASKTIDTTPELCEYLTTESYFTKNYFIFSMFFLQLLLVGHL
jgi:hypothetical protein